MALNWIEITIVKRSEGKNVIARAAYNARERLVDERTNVVYDYRQLANRNGEAFLIPSMPRTRSRIVSNYGTQSRRSKTAARAVTPLDSLATSRSRCRRN